jgi:hypothetical protein
MTELRLIDAVVGPEESRRPAEEPRDDEALDAYSRVVTDVAGALAPAVALSGRAGTGKIVCVVSGGNIDFSKLSVILAGETPA